MYFMKITMIFIGNCACAAPLTEMVVPAQDPQNARLLQLVELAQACPVLCAVHGGMRGTQRVNDFMRRRHPRGSADLQPGEPVMVQANDYARSLFNGDFGVVADIGIHKPHASPCAVFKTETGCGLRVGEFAGGNGLCFFRAQKPGQRIRPGDVRVARSGFRHSRRELVFTAHTRATACRGGGR
jgi:hypothetical protein